MGLLCCREMQRPRPSQLLLLVFQKVQNILHLALQSVESTGKDSDLELQEKKHSRSAEVICSSVGNATSSSTEISVIRGLWVKVGSCQNQSRISGPMYNLIVPFRCFSFCRGHALTVCNHTHSLRLLSDEGPFVSHVRSCDQADLAPDVWHPTRHDLRRKWIQHEKLHCMGDQ